MPKISALPSASALDVSPEAILPIVLPNSPLTTRKATLAQIFEQALNVVNVKFYGAVGDGATDDAAAIQEAIDAVSARGGRVYIPSGTYLLGTQLDLDGDGITLEGDGQVGHVAVAGATILTATHSAGSVIRVWGVNCTVMDMTLSSSAARYAGAAGTNYGLRVEGADTSSGRTDKFTAERVRITNQPNHGLLLIGICAQTYLESVNVDNCDGHGWVVNSGRITGRTNVQRPGQIVLMNCSSTRTGGHAILVGDDLCDTAASTELPYRVQAFNFETFYNNADALIPLQDYVWYVVGENHEFHGSALRGDDDGGTDTHGGSLICGDHILFNNIRFLQCNPYIADIESRAALVSDDIRIVSPYIVNTFQSPGFYNPAISVDTASRNISASYNGNATIVATLMPTTNLRYLIELNGTRTSGGSETFNGNVTLAAAAGAGVAPSATTAMNFAAGTTAVSSLRINHGSAPTSPVDGDMWTTTAGLFIRINGSTVGPLS